MELENEAKAAPQRAQNSRCQSVKRFANHNYRVNDGAKTPMSELRKAFLAKERKRSGSFTS